MVKHIVSLILLLFGITFTPGGKVSAHVEKTYFLKGTIGNRGIAIKMLCYDEMPVRHLYYFFSDDKKDRYLVGSYKNKTWNFIGEEQHRNAHTKPVGALNLEESNNGNWKGAWTDSTGKSWDVVLAPIIPDSISSPYNYLPYVSESDPYERYRLSAIKLTKQKTEKHSKEVVMDWYTEQESGISFLRLRPVNNRRTMDSINASLETLHLSLVQKCYQYHPGKMGTKTETTILYRTNELISLQIVSKTTFRSQTTTQARQLLTYNISSGEPVNLEEIIWFDKNEKIPPMSELYAIYKYRKKVFAPKIFNLLQELYPDKMKSDSCDINKPDAWALPVWTLTNKGIAFSFSSFEQCDVLQWAMVPFKKVEPFMVNKYNLNTRK